jgi:hypothetical protein
LRIARARPKSAGTQVVVCCRRALRTGSVACSSCVFAARSRAKGPLYVLECRRRSTLDMIACVHAADRVAAWQAMFDDLRRKGVMPADATE